MGREKCDDPEKPETSAGPRTPESEAGPVGELPEGEDAARAAAIPDLLRRLMAVGLSGFFTTEEAVRRALGDTLPQDWVDFAASQSDRTRSEFFDRLAAEFGRTLDKVDLTELAEQLLEGRTIEVRAQFRLGERRSGERGGERDKEVQAPVAGRGKSE